MTHIAARIVADHLADAEQGLAAVLAVLPLDTGDTRPAFTATAIYDETRDSWVARGQVPREGAAITYPCVAVRVALTDEETGAPDQFAAGNSIPGTVTVECFLLQRDVDSAKAATDAMYLTRALRGSLYLLDVAPASARTRLATSLDPSTSRQAGRPDEDVGDLPIAAGVRMTYPTREGVPT